MKSLAPIALIIIVAAHAHATPAPNFGSAAAPIQLNSKDGLQRIKLPLSVLQASRSHNLADVRVIDSKGESLPIAWAQSPPNKIHAKTLAIPRFGWPSEADPTPVNVSGVTVQINDAGAVININVNTPPATTRLIHPRTWLLDLSGVANADAALTRITLDWPQQATGLATHVRVEGSTDTVHWDVITHAQLLELQDADPTAPSLKYIDWPSTTTPRYVRLVFDTPIILTRSDATWTHVETTAALQQKEIDFTPVVTDKQPAYWELDLQGAVSLRSLQIHPAQPNSVIAWRLERRNDTQQAWAVVTQFVAWRLTRDGQESTSTAIDLPSAPAARFWRLVPDTRTPLPHDAALKATIMWSEPELIFVAGTESPLWLVVGKEKTVSTAVALATLIPDYQAGTEFALPLAQLGPLEPQKIIRPDLLTRLSQASHEDKKSWLLWFILTGAVLGLMVYALRLGKEITGKK